MEGLRTMKSGEIYNIRVTNQLVSGMFIREVKRLWMTRYEFQVDTHIRDFDYNREYDTKRVYTIKKSDIISKAG